MVKISGWGGDFIVMDECDEDRKGIQQTTRQNIDIGTLYREQQLQRNWVIWGTFCEVVQGWQANFRIAARGACIRKKDYESNNRV